MNNILNVRDYLKLANIYEPGTLYKPKCHNRARQTKLPSNAGRNAKATVVHPPNRS